MVAGRTAIASLNPPTARARLPAMGLLDDAIREHLDLKRRHGATEDEIARKEAEALGPVRRVVRPDDEEPDGQDVDGAVAADPRFRGDESLAADGEDDSGHPYPSEDRLVTNDAAVDNLSRETLGPPEAFADDETRVLPAPGSEPPLEDDDFTRAESDAATDQPYDDDRTRLRPVASDQPFDDDAPAFGRPAASEPRLTRIDDETFADGEPAAVPPPEDARASVEPEAADFAPPAYGEPYDPLDPLFDAAPEPDTASSAGRDWVSRPARSHDEVPAEEAALSEQDAAQGPAAYRIGPRPADEPPDEEWVHAEPSGRDDVSPPEAVDTAPPGAEEPPRPPGPGGSRPAGGQNEAPAGKQPDSPDVLEETPDFLQETPEHDRLWFEQRPPRDFDFDD